MEVMNKLFGKPKHEVMAEMALIKPPIKSTKLIPHSADPKGSEYLAEYAELASVIGIAPPDLVIEKFKAFLIEKDLPVYSLPEVIAYMDDKAGKESKEKAGWEWKPLREKDRQEMTFGKAASSNFDGRAIFVTPASDYYANRRPEPEQVLNANMFLQVAAQSLRNDAMMRLALPSPVYDRTIPLHAVRRIALIEKEFEGNVAFFVSDYALLPAVQYPDPFLMAVIPNANVARGEGRFVIDFWDEPGFGINKMLK